METWHAYNADGPRIFKNWSITDGTRKIATIAEHPTTEAEHECARLIAAAPELLAALENARNVLAGIASGDLKTVKTDSPALIMARAAINKATGND